MKLLRLYFHHQFQLLRMFGLMLEISHSLLNLHLFLRPFESRMPRVMMLIFLWVISLQVVMLRREPLVK